MRSLWLSLIELDPSLAILLAILGSVSSLLALLTYVAWLLSKQLRPRRDLHREAQQREKELQAALTPGGWPNHRI